MGLVSGLFVISINHDGRIEFGANFASMPSMTI